VRVCEELFSAARAEFKHLEYFYFHNFLYESVWRNNRRRNSERTPTFDVLHKYAHDYKLIFVGDATMSPYEIAYPGGSIEHNNEETGAVWLNPTAEERWGYYESIGMVRQLMADRMFPLTLDGLDRAMRALAR